MLLQIRDKAQGWVAWIIIGVLILAMGFWGISYYMNSGGNTAEAVVAKFAGMKITKRELGNAYNRYRMHAGKRAVNSVAGQKLLRQQILQQMITQKIMAQAALDDNLFVNQQQINSVLTQIPAFQMGGKFSPAQFQIMTSRMLFTVPGFLENIKQTMLINQIQSGIIGSAFSLPNEVRHTLGLVHQRRDFDYAVLAKSRVAKSVNITADEIKQYYQQHQEQFSIPEKISLQYVTLSADKIMQSIKPTKGQLYAFYQQNITDYTQPVKWHVAHILLDKQAEANKVYQQAKASKNFASLAKKYSQDPLSAKHGGELSWFGPGQLDPTFETAVSNLKVNQVSEPVKTKYGYEIIKLLAEQPQKALPYSSVASKVHKAYVLQQAQQKFSDMKDQLANISFENPNSLAPVAKQLALKLATTVSFTKTGGKTGITKLPQVVTAAFDDDVLSGNNSDVITISPKAVVVIRVKQHQDQAVKSLTNVSSQIKGSLTKTASVKALEAYADKIITAYQHNIDPQLLAKQYKFSWRSITNHARHGDKLNQMILQKAFTMSRPVKHAILAGVDLANGDYALVLLKHIRDGKANAVASKIFSKQMQRNNGEVEYLEYAKQLHKAAAVKLMQASNNS